MLADIRILQEQVAKLQLSTNQLTSALADTNKRLNDQAASTARGFADLQALIKNSESTINNVREKLDDNTVRVSTLTQEMAAIRTGLQRVTDQLNTLVGLIRPPVNPTDPDGTMPSPPAPGAAGVLAPIGVPTSPARALSEAMGYYMGERMELAIEAFDAYIKEFPDSPEAARAQHYIGLAYAAQRKCPEAIDAYNKTLATYKTYEKLPDVYVDQGICYQTLGRSADARKAYETVRKLYPESTAAALAEQRLKLMAPAR
jgi:tol-pal system protein YbgF